MSLGWRHGGLTRRFTLRECHPDMQPGRRPLALLLLILVVGSTVAAGAVGGVSVPPATDGDAAVHQTDRTTTTNETQHENPDEVGEDGDLLDLSGWLAQWLAERLGNSTLHLSQAQYEFARSLIGDVYSDRLAQLIDVAGETEGGDDDRAATLLNETQSQQADYIDLIEEYKETLAAYEAALEAGNLDRARELARELQALADQIDRSTDALVANYELLANLTGADLASAIERLEALETNVTETVAALEADLFVETELRLVGGQQQISFLDPLELRGRLTTANGTAIANRTITIAIGSQRLQVETNATGWFATSYRPTLLPLSTTAVTARYEPQNASQYLGSSDSLPVTVQGVQPTLEITSRTETARFGDTVSVSGRLQVENIPAGGVPVVLSIDGTTIGTARTAPDGRYTVTGSLPAGIAPGEATVTVRTATDGRALEPVTATATIQVEETPTQLQVVVEQLGDRLRIRGQLETVDGEVIPNQRLRVELGTESFTVQTGPEGGFSTVLDLPSVESGTTRTVPLVVAFTGTGTNLAGITHEESLQIEAPPDRGETSQDEDEGPLGGIVDDISDTVGDLPVVGEIIDQIDEGIQDVSERTGLSPAVIVAIILAIVLGLAALLARRLGWRPTLPGTPGIGAWIAGRWPGRPSLPTTGSSQDGADSPGTPAATEPPASTEADSGPLAGAEADLAAGDTDRAVERAYNLVRASLTGDSPTARVLTHWELLRDYATDTEDRDALRRLTELYERAAYAPNRTSETEADTALDVARQLLEPPDSSGGD